MLFNFETIKARKSMLKILRIPAICPLCAHYHRNCLAICEDCILRLIPIGPACTNCATPLPSKGFLTCGACIKKKPHFDKAWIGYRFEEPLRGLLHRFKYQENLYLGSFLTHLMLKSIPQNFHTQCLIPIPMHPTRLKERGFNQAQILAKLLGKSLNIPYNIQHCHKIINTAPQATLSGQDRRKNLHKAFAVKPIPYTKVTLVDDLLTTGSTANALAKILKQNGATEVDIWCCART